MSRTVFSCAIVLFTCLASSALGNDAKIVIKVEKTTSPQVSVEKPPFTGQRAAVDVAILLDTSNSMDGLIGQAKSQLWTIVQQFAKAKKNGQTPILRVALFEYGNTRLPASEGYIRQAVPLTDDLDKLSEALFALTTNGGDEYCGQVIDEAITRLDWSKEPNGYKAIFIAGNEPFTQGTVDYHQACKRAIEHGVVVNTIHCGNNQQGLSGQWQHGAQLAEGQFFNIDQDRAVVHIKCPQDEIIIRLNAELNKTYLWYGKQPTREKNRANQVAQDSNAFGVGGAAVVERAITKAGPAYKNRNRDLVDTYFENEAILDEVESEELPQVLQKLKPGQRKALIEKMTTERSKLQAQISQLSRERESFLTKEKKRLAQEAGGETLGDAVVAAIQRQLVVSGFETENKPE